MQYNIYLSTFQYNDSFINNLKRKINFYKILANELKSFKLYGATISKNIGFYEGVKENSFMLQIITNYDKDVMLNFCKNLRYVFNQDSILLQIISENILIYSDKIENI